jgi:hypothetical protein
VSFLRNAVFEAMLSWFGRPINVGAIIADRENGPEAVHVVKFNGVIADSDFARGIYPINLNRKKDIRPCAF